LRFLGVDLASPRIAILRAVMRELWTDLRSPFVLKGETGHQIRNFL